MRFAIATLCLIALASCCAKGQQVGPTALEFKGPKAHGSIMVRNNSTGILTVTTEIQSFDWVRGMPRLVPLDTSIEFRTKQAILTLGPKQTKYVDFDARCAKLPCHFYVTPTFTTPPTGEGLNIALHLPVATYLCRAKKRCRIRTLEEHGAIGKK